MSSDIAVREHVVLDRLRESYEHRGFQFFMAPLVEMLPGFLHGFRPDAIALKPGENHVVEVKFSRRPGEDRRLETLAKLVSGQSGWQLKVFYEAPRPEDDLHFRRATPGQIAAQIDEAEQLAAGGHLKAALLLAWSALEAIARAQPGGDDATPQRLFSPAQTVQSLEMAGVIDRAIGRTLRESAQLRNQAAHGGLDAAIDVKPVAELLGLLRRLAAPSDADVLDARC